MADNNTPDYASLLQQLKQAEERQKQAEERQKQAEERQEQAEYEGRQERERREQAEERQKQAEDEGRQDRELIRQTTFVELLANCHNLLCRPLRAETPRRSTTGKIPAPKGKYCPKRLAHWDDCATELTELYESVCRPLSSERDVECYKPATVEDHVRDIITELCKLPAACNKFSLSDGIKFSSHINLLNKTKVSEVVSSSTPNPRPDQFCIHRVDHDNSTILTSVEYKPPHKLSVETLRIGLRPMDLWKEMVKSNKILTSQQANFKRLACSAIVQEYHVIIQEGLEYSYVTNGIARVLLRVPEDDPNTLYYFFCDPNSEVDPAVNNISQLSRTSVARTLCLCLLAFRSPQRSQDWRDSTRDVLELWTTSFNHTYSQIFKAEKQQATSQSDVTTPEFPSPDSGSLFEPPSSSPDLPIVGGRQVAAKFQGSCAPGAQRRSRSPDSSGSDTNRTTGRKRNFSQVASSPSARRAAHQHQTSNNQGSQSRRRDAQFCTQRCLLGLQTRGILDDCCPNVMLHRQNNNHLHHPTTSEGLVHSLKALLDKSIDECTLFGDCRAYSALFKLTCPRYGYTVVGKGTTSGLWGIVSREAEVYHLLREVQGSAVPVFLGTINLKKIYFLYGAGEIRYMLVMGWGGESIVSMELTSRQRQEIRRSTKNIKALRIIYNDLRPDNILWNEELQRMLIIDFHRSSLRSKPSLQREKTAKRRLCQAEPTAKRLHVL
ncbi:hypothetical protein BDW59DRAFT_173501 [Aspergillus cavernicola]|uniref:Protein kinase domain-containing protein n=1 Tax=Aspergillus cavernicola TaxID=176166 RepID=A0ABR4I8N5_9EURO